VSSWLCPHRVVVYKIDSYVHGYMDKWEYEVGEVLPLRREPENEVNVNPIMKDREVVGH